MSDRQLAVIAGVDKDTMNETRKRMEDSGEVAVSATSTGADGKTRRRKRRTAQEPATAPFPLTPAHRAPDRPQPLYRHAGRRRGDGRPLRDRCSGLTRDTGDLPEAGGVLCSVSKIL